MNREKYTISSKKTVVSVVQTEVDSIKTENTVKTGIRMYDGKHIGVAGAIGKYDGDKLDRQAEENLKSGISYPYELSCDRSESREDIREIIADPDFLGEMEEMLAELKKSQPKFAFSNKVVLAEETRAIENDRGLDLFCRDRTIELILLFKEKTSANIMDGYAGYGGVKYDRQSVLDRFNEICGAYMNLVDLEKEGKLPVVFSSKDQVLFQKLAGDLNGLSYGTGSSLLSGKLSEKLFHDEFTLFQNLDPEGRESNLFFDAEGVVNGGYRHDFIRDGVFVSPYADKKTASVYKLKGTGSAASQYDSVPRISALGLEFKHGSRTVKELLGGRRGIYVMIASGGDYTPQGDFATPVQLAFYFDGEKFLGRLPQIQVHSNVFDMFGKDFEGVSSDREFTLQDSHYILMDMDVSRL